MVYSLEDTLCFDAFGIVIIVKRNVLVLFVVCFFSQADSRPPAKKRKKNAVGNVKRRKCWSCNKHFENGRELHRHQILQHRQTGGAELQNEPWPANEDPFANIPNGDEIRRMYEQSRPYILAAHYGEPDDLKKYYNFPVKGEVTDQNIRNQLNFIYNREQHAFRLNIGAGVILRHQDGELRYFKPSSYFEILNTALYVRNRRGLNRAIDFLIDQNLNEMIRNFRPGSDYSVIWIGHLEFYIYSSKFNLGAENAAEQLPDFIKNHHHIVSVYPKRLENKSLCAFVGLAQKRGLEERGVRDYRLCKSRVLDMYYEWLEFCQDVGLRRYMDTRLEQFRGLDMSDMSYFEKCFRVCVNIHCLGADMNSYSVYNSTEKYEEVIHFNMYDDHLSWISNIELYSKKFACEMCDKLFNHRGHLHRHMKSCGQKTKHQFKGGNFKQHVSIFEKLDYIGVHVPHDIRFYPFLVTWDMESILKPSSNPEGEQLVKQLEKKLVVTEVHIPISCSITANVENFTSPYTIIDDNPEMLVQRMVEYFYKIREQTQREVWKRWGRYYQQLLDKIIGYMNQRADELLQKTEDASGRDFAKKLKKDLYCRQLLDAMTDFKRYLSQNVIIGFNTSSYDTNLIRSELTRFFVLCEDKRVTQLTWDTYIPVHQQADIEEPEMDYEIDFENEVGVSDNFSMLSVLDDAAAPQEDFQIPIPEVMNRVQQKADLDRVPAGKVCLIKRTNRYLCTSNNHWRFLDAINYLPPGVNLVKFLDMFNIEVGKFYFPYHAIKDAENLNDPLPAYDSESWISTLKGGNVLAQEWDNWKLNGKKGREPATGRENYELVCKVWKEANMKTLRDLLIYYNERDSLPLLLACDKLQNCFKELNLDCWKDGISVSGMARNLIFRHAAQQKCTFPLFPERDRHLDFMIRKQLAAGASIIFTREQKAGETPLRPDDVNEISQLQIGYDAASLYPYCEAMEQPVYNYCVRNVNDGFIPHYSLRYPLMHLWLAYREKVDGVKIQTGLTLGFELRVDSCYLDGLAIDDQNQLVCYEFHGWLPLTVSIHV